MNKRLKDLLVAAAFTLAAAGAALAACPGGYTACGDNNQLCCPAQ